ncbi:putative oxidoreductase YesF [Cytospora mali]|uniref:Oxidoreductase YesF n=1 Tax=Cytospora mali TaxID=578113 RepID=A0A194VZE0_CYTMA|nr:putative oxidoreductase YesF [Valsa mali]
MASRYDNVIVFGPTGTVGGIVAREASKRGAKVWLAMRDPSKPIPEIPADVEKAGKFNRVQADLTDPASVGNAVKESGAKAAYVYHVASPGDYMRGTLKAMKDAGVEYVVFLSSASIAQGVDIRSVPKEKIIPYTHAQVEIAVEEVGFPYFTALRPWVFASNHFKVNLDKSVKPPKANIVHTDVLTDNIVPDDIGAVGGAVLVERPSNGKEVIYLCGPEIKQVDECWAIIKRVTGRDDIDTTPMTREELIEKLTSRIPAPYAHYLVKAQDGLRNIESFPDSMYVPAVANIKKYSGREATKFEDYIAAHKAEWQAI